MIIILPILPLINYNILGNTKGNELMVEMLCKLFSLKIILDFKFPFEYNRECRTFRDHIVSDI